MKEQVPQHAPKDHPKVKAPQVGVLLLNLGTPDATDYFSMRRYLSEFLSDRRVIDYPKWFWQPLLQGIILTSRPFRSGAAYRKIWNNDKNESPLKTYTRSQCDKIKTRFEQSHPDVHFEWGMRYGNPSTKAGIDALIAKGCKKILLFALYPQYSACTTATAYDKSFDVLKHINHQPVIRTAQHWCDDPAYIDALANSVTAAIKDQKTDPEHIVVSFHGLPKRYLMQGDPYHCFCQKTSRLVREKLGWPEEKWTTAFQSRFGPEEWLQPYFDKTIENLAEKGIKRIAVISPAFVSECVETLEEIKLEGREEFIKAGGEEYTYVPCLNDTDAHIDLLSARIEQELAGWI